VHVYTWLDPWMTNYGFGYGPPRSLAGLIHALRGDPSSSFVLGCCTCSGAACWSSSSFIWSGGHLCHQVLVLGRAKHQTYLQEMPRLGMGRAQVATAWNWGPQELAYGYVPAASTPIDSSWCGGDGSKANCCNYRRRGSSLSLISSLVVTQRGRQPV
jgi:hypothetical protein